MPRSTAPSVRLLIVSILSLASISSLPGASPSAPAFQLRSFDNRSTVRLADFAGKVVVLDFFAHWCGPCARSAPLLEREVQQYYARQGGNPKGLAVQVVSINVEEDGARETAAFVRKHRPNLVLNDEAGETLKAYGGAALPFLVIVDASRTNATASPIVYRHAGFEGVERLRRIIDGLGTSPGAPSASN